jgi:hypothetical protein
MTGTLPDALPLGIALVYDADENMQKLEAELPEHWSSMPVDDEGEREWVEQVVLPHLRAAYGSGYMKGLASEPSSSVPTG